MAMLWGASRDLTFMQRHLAILLLVINFQFSEDTLKTNSKDKYVLVQFFDSLHGTLAYFFLIFFHGFSFLSFFHFLLAYIQDLNSELMLVRQVLYQFESLCQPTWLFKAADKKVV
jgi:hypothetical protein